MLRVYRDRDEIPAGFPPSAVTIGNFDGVHRGHQRILHRVRERAAEHGLQSVAVLFDPHPTRIVAPERAPALLMSPESRLKQFSEQGLNAAVVLAFTRDFARLSPRTFVEEVLTNALHARWVVVGESFRFGHRQAGDLPLLRKLGAELGFEAEAVSPVLVRGQPISSTRVREAVARGQVDLARRLLGRPFTLEGPVVPGRGIGSRQTVPTMNVAPESEVLPARGVYISAVQDALSGDCWPGITNVGIRPTFGGGPLTVETHVLEHLRGPAPQQIEVAFFRRLREERQFATPQALRQQILADAADAARFFRRLQLVRTRSASSVSESPI
jgi:riboflavin kinase/FMN adenylyltransferase